MRITVLTLNTWALPVALPQLRRRRRVKEIGDAVARMQPDVVLFQELFHPPSRQRLLDGLASHLGAGPTARSRRSAWGMQWDCTGGLVSASRFDVVDEEFHAHEIVPTMRADERLARKGYLVSRLRLHGREVVLVNVHLCSGNSRSDVATRRRQNRALIARLREIDPATPVIVGGDFNERSRGPGVSGENGSPSLTSIGFRDLWTDLGVTPRATYDIARNRYGRSWYNPTRVPAPFDRVLVRDGRSVSVQAREARVVFDRPETILSDHFGLVTVIELEPRGSSPDSSGN